MIRCYQVLTFFFFFAPITDLNSHFQGMIWTLSSGKNLLRISSGTWAFFLCVHQSFSDWWLISQWLEGIFMFNLLEVYSSIKYIQLQYMPCKHIFHIYYKNVLQVHWVIIIQTDFKMSYLPFLSSNDRCGKNWNIVCGF